MPNSSKFNKKLRRFTREPCKSPALAGSGNDLLSLYWSIKLQLGHLTRLTAHPHYTTNARPIDHTPTLPPPATLPPRCTGVYVAVAAAIAVAGGVSGAGRHSADYSAQYPVQARAYPAGTRLDIHNIRVRLRIIRASRRFIRLVFICCDESHGESGVSCGTESGLLSCTPMVYTPRKGAGGEGLLCVMEKACFVAFQ
ncbi:hypothetical protein C8J56DRAFT_879863 [Mycena floridula]|nr:hypothetical protein C8J56DRAFT_879863 [Mycena floridula]